MTTAFTPGPWEAHIGEDYFAVFNKSGNYVVPECRCDPSSERDVADVNLIAAAPDLYAALKELIDSIEDAGGHDENGDVFDIRRALAALAKAEGAQP